MATREETYPQMYNDNFRVERECDGLVYYMEHNLTEAKALKRWLQSDGTQFKIVAIAKDVVRRAKAVQAKVNRHPWRDEAFEMAGIVGKKSR